MNTTRLRRSFVAITFTTTTIAGLVLMPSTAGASPVISGMLTLYKPTVIAQYDLASASCPATATFPVIGLDVTTPPTIAVTGFESRLVIPPAPPAQSYLVVIKRLSSGGLNGALSASPAPYTITTAMRMVLQIDMYIQGDFTTACVPTGPSRCGLAVMINVTGTLDDITSASPFSLTGTSQGVVVGSPSCSGGPGWLIGSTAGLSLTGML